MGGNGKTKVVWGLELSAAFICLGVDLLFPKTLEQSEEGAEGRGKGNKSVEENANVLSGGSRLPAHSKHAVEGEDRGRIRSLLACLLL